MCLGQSPWTCTLVIIILHSFIGSLEARKFYRGIDFVKMHEYDTPVVDKSLLIKEMLEDPNKTVLISRPHGFGKSLNLSMMKAFLTINGTASKLFKNLAITQEVEFCKRHQNQHPVIHISFAGVRGTTFDECKKKLTVIMNNLYLEHMYLGTSDRLTEVERKNFTASYTGSNSEFQALLLISKLMKLMTKHFDKKIILLMEDYDALVLSAQLYQFHVEMLQFTRGVMESIFNDESLYKGVIVGIFTERKNLFSGFKNLAMYSVCHEKYAEFFGFTESEVLKLKDDYRINNPSAMAIVKDLYEGYRIGKHVLMNSWSIVHFFIYGAQPGNYWMQDLGGSALLNGTLKDGVMTDALADKLLNGVEILLEPDLLTLDLRSPDDIYWIYLLQFGFFTVTHLEKTSDGKTLCQLRIPNKEIKLTVQEAINLFLKKRGSQQVIMGASESTVYPTGFFL